MNSQAALRCCHETPYKEILAEDFTASNYLGEVFRVKIEDEIEPESSNEILNDDVVSLTIN